MAAITIEWLTDYHDCETCGYSYAEGAAVKLDGELILDLVPVAHCFGGQSWDQERVYNMLLEKLGHEVESPANGDGEA